MNLFCFSHLIILLYDDSEFDCLYFFGVFFRFYFCETYSLEIGGHCALCSLCFLLLFLFVYSRSLYLFTEMFMFCLFFLLCFSFHFSFLLFNSFQRPSFIFSSDFLPFWSVFYRFYRFYLVYSSQDYLDLLLFLN